VDCIEIAVGDGVLALSPHLDDAVFACGEVLATAGCATVVTVFAGRPRAGIALTAWDRDCGFQPGDDVVGARRDEDCRALERLGAVPLWLDFCDDQYGSSATIEAIAEALKPIVMRARVHDVLAPLGLFHFDHQRTHAAALIVAKRVRERRWLFYEDALYRRFPGLRDARIDALANEGYAPRPVRILVERSAHERKREAVACYGSQIRALATSGRPGHADALTAEQYWQILPYFG